ncbi:MAG: SMC-Scp complex subunit ScpB, partial [Xanthomonadales bacterium]|nr:SMC-Scp complex subunit ScpB [Xanthomonadales bacterium]
MPDTAPPPLKQIIEAALLASGEAMTPAQLAELFDEDQRPGTSEIGKALEQLAADCEGRGVELS